MVSTLLQARDAANAALFSGATEDALRSYLSALIVAPQGLDLRLRVADSLLACGQVQRAAVVYMAVARHAAIAGYPLRALVAIKVLTALEPALLSDLSSIADLYALDSGRIGRTVRPVDVLSDVELTDEAEAVLHLAGEGLFERAEAVGKDLANAGAVLGGALPPIPLLSELGRADFMSVFQMVQLVRKRPGEIILAQGEPGHAFFIIARGDVDVVRNDDAAKVVLASLAEGAVVGEMALLSNAPRSADVIARTDTDLLELSVEALSTASHGVAAIARALDKFTRERLVSNLMNTAPLFAPLTRTQRIDLVRRFVAHEVALGTDLIQEGEPGRGLYVVLTGAVDVSKRDGNEKVLLATLGPGQVFGEMSLLSDAPASATVTAAQRSTVLFLAREYVARLIETVPALKTYLETLGDEREMDTRLWLSNAVNTEHLMEDIEIELVE